jgi:asparagine synthetase B (glutamine-hydrolysing)
LHLAFSDVNNPIWSYGVYGDFNWVRDHYGVSHQEVIAHRCQQTQQLANRSFNDALAIYALDCCEVSITTTLWSKLAEGQRKILYYPFVSQELLNTAFSIPWELKLKSVKHVLRRVGRQLSVPEFILNRPKQSFGIASDRWAERGGALEPLITLAAKAVDKDQLRNLQGRDPRKAMTLWSLLNYALLKRLFVMGESPQSLLDELSDNCAAGRGAPEVPSLVS